MGRMNTSIAYNLRSGMILKGSTHSSRPCERSKKTTQEKDDGPVALAEDDGAPVTEKLSLVEDDGGSVTEKAALAVAVDTKIAPFCFSKSFPGKDVSEVSFEEILDEVYRAAGRKRKKPVFKPGHPEETWRSWANKALEHYNSKQNAKFRLVEVTTVVQDAKSPKVWVHMNFKAKSDDDDASSKPFFSEMHVPWKGGLEIDINGCCVLEQVDSVLHPTSRYGYRSASGDFFTDLESRI